MCACGRWLNLLVHLLLLSTCHSRGICRTFYMFAKVEWGLCSSFNVESFQVFTNILSAVLQRLLTGSGQDSR